ncbi:MAG: thermopsin family protease [Conexivisphaerales archaeon]
MSKKPGQKTKFGKRKLAILTIVILIVIVISALLYSSRTFLSKVAPVKFVQSGPIILATPNHIYNVTLNKTSYKVYELSIPKNSSSSYVATTITYTVKSNSTVVSLLLTESQLNLFRNETTKESMFNSIFYSNNSILNNVFIENTSSKNITLFLVVFPQNSTSNIAFNYTISFITHLNSFNSLSLPNGGFGVIGPNNVISIKVPFEVTNISTIYLYGLSNQTIIYSIFDNSTNKTVYLSKPVTVVGNQTNEYISIKNLTPGSYSIILFNKHNSSVLYDFWYTESPYIVNPYIYSRGNNAEGLVSYGISNRSSILSAYTINTSALEGFLNLSSLYVYNSSQLLASHFLSAQLNGVLVVTNKNGTIKTYWVQNIAHIYAVNRFYYLADNLWGEDITNKTIEGRGQVIYDNISKESFYAYGTNLSFYNYPFSFALQSIVSVSPNKGINLSECYQPLQNGKNLSVSLHGYCYDNIFINDSNVASAKFMISGSNYPINIPPLYYDAEFVIGGGFNGSLATIQNLNATLGLYYFDNSTSSYIEFPSYYSFADDTAEEISNVNAKYNHNYAILEAGNNDEVYLGNGLRFMPLININNVNLTEEVTYFGYPPQNYSYILNGFSISAGAYYNYYVVTTEGSSTCTITGFRSLTPGIYLTNVNITLPYTLTSGSTLNWQFTIFTNPFYNYTGNLNILEYENC